MARIVRYRVFFKGGGGGGLLAVEMNFKRFVFSTLTASYSSSFSVLKAGGGGGGGGCTSISPFSTATVYIFV